jgi:hypothetical protein
MSNVIYTPKKSQIHVPGAGVVQREDFTQDHAIKLLKRAEKNGVDKKVFIKQHFEVSVNDLPLFDDEQEAETKPVRRKKEVVKSDEELLEQMIKEEEKAKSE